MGRWQIEDWLQGGLSSSKKEGETIIAVSMKQKTAYRLAFDSELPTILGAAVGEPAGDNTWRLRTLYAEDPTTAIMLMGAAIERWKRVLPDYSVSPAAQAVLKRYFEQNVDDPTKVEVGADSANRKDQNEADFLKSAYLAPVGFDLGRAEDNGDAAVNSAVDANIPPVKEARRVREWLRQLASKGFDEAYKSDIKTKRVGTQTTLKPQIA